eukprot:CAMPEP_0197608534 /NCGR_PEP_ID=MMETSP1326-20131121/49275_1 /TAXON_ID=1155430 /ORGANISM="Genus nov. species nov., Strain RCC2288" /LENGTH=407 /DNA_ID=CAMNT_0043176745 /DNA_START=36 /DNA_END=1259 /DNA_ORIENTATION=-
MGLLKKLSRKKVDAASSIGADDKSGQRTSADDDDKNDLSVAPAPAPADAANDNSRDAGAGAGTSTAPLYEEIGGRTKAADGTWIAWELVRPVGVGAGHPVSSKASLLVTVNGLSNDNFQWQGLMPVLRRDHAVLSWDFRGHGCSENPRDVRAVSIASLAEDLEVVMQDVSARGLASTSHVTVVAYSMGCQVALEWCRDHGHRVDGLALILGTPQYSMESLLGKRLGDAAATLMDNAVSFFLWDCIFAVTFISSWISHGAALALGLIGVTWGQFAPFYRHMKRLHGGAYARMLVSGQRHSAMDVLEQLDRREVPTLIVTGGRDFAVSKATVQRMHAAAPRASFIHLPRACHAGMIGERGAVVDALEKFFELEGAEIQFNRDRKRAQTGVGESPADTPPKDPHGQPIQL